jgi:hypothetical protein
VRAVANTRWLPGHYIGMVASDPIKTVPLCPLPRNTHICVPFGNPCGHSKLLIKIRGWNFGHLIQTAHNPGNARLRWHCPMVALSLRERISSRSLP